MAIAITLMTAEEFLRLAEDPPSELVRGKVVGMQMPGYSHGEVCAQMREVCAQMRDEDPVFPETLGDFRVPVRRFE